MNMRARYFCLIIFISFSSSLYAQLGGIGNKLKQMATDPENVAKGKKALGDQNAKERTKLDSIDFQYAISINDNAGFFNVNEKGEMVNMAAGVAFRNEADKTEVENAREELDLAMAFYEARRYKEAQTYLEEVRVSMEQKGLQGEIVYLRCISNLGLVHLAQGRMFEAQQYIDEAVSLSSKNLGTKSAAYVANMNNEAKLNQMSGKYNSSKCSTVKACNMRFC
jgi:tetratricopeptide (TPR) repeat protein